MFCIVGLANRGLGNLETAQDDKVEEAVKMQALADGNRFYADCKIEFFVRLFDCFSSFVLLFYFYLVTERAREKGVSISVITIAGMSLSSNHSYSWNQSQKVVK